MAVRWYLAYPLSSRQVLEFLAERGIDVSHRTVLNWVQTFGPLLAAEVRQHHRRVGRGWFVGVVLEVLLLRHRDTASAEAFFRQAIERTGVIPDEVVTDHHQPYVKAVATA